MLKHFLVSLAVLFSAQAVAVEIPRELRIGRAGHAFDHLSGIGEQAEAAAASGSTILYTSGLGIVGYDGLPPQTELQALRKSVSEYNKRAKQDGIELAIGYLCATSMVKLDTFDKNWTDEFRAQFKTKPTEWRQQDRQGKPLASWYGGDYNPACMSNPDWRAYEHAMVREQLETGHDGIFFDNPTVHPQGCYCPHCMQKFAESLEQVDIATPRSGANDSDRIESIRKLADAHPKEFLRFRSTVARDFVADMRGYARTINPQALITCNNSLNSPGVFYSQCRDYGYSIDEMSKTEDFVVVEDMSTQPRADANGQSVEYGPMYKQLHAISHGKPVVAVTIANGDYHTAPNLMRLAMAEAAANNASYLSWPTWPEKERARLIATVRPQADFLRRNEELLNVAAFRTDVVLYLPFRRWVDTPQCAESNVAAALTKANIQYRVIGEDDLATIAAMKHRPALVVASLASLSPSERAAIAAYEKDGPGVFAADKPNWLEEVSSATVKPSVRVEGPATVRAVVHDQPERTIVHLYNLNVQRLSSFEDKVTPAKDVELAIRTPINVGKVNIQTADEKGTSGSLKFQVTRDGKESVVHMTVPRLDINAIVTIEK